METSARLKLYSKKLCSSITWILEFSVGIVLCLKFDAGKTGDYFRSDTDWCIIECQFGWWLDALGD
jgi:hypothetical protein